MFTVPVFFAIGYHAQIFRIIAKKQKGKQQEYHTNSRSHYNPGVSPRGSLN
jgi:hypothetical protein